MLRKIADLDFALCASPGYLRRAGAPTDISDLSEHDCLINTHDQIWHLRQDGHDVHLKIGNAVYSSNSYLTLRKAALADRGVALLPVRLIADELADGSLVDVVDGVEAPVRPLYALHSPGGQTPARVTMFLDFVSDWFRRQSPPAVRPLRPVKSA
jgi:DNA-binding transcriptional LysR family regulator